MVFLSAFDGKFSNILSSISIGSGHVFEFFK